MEAARRRALAGMPSRNAVSFRDSYSRRLITTAGSRLGRVTAYVITYMNGKQPAEGAPDGSGQAPLKSAGRFSRKARVPSLASSEPMTFQPISSWILRASSSGRWEVSR
ncbi:hypothetical protein EDD29_7636 [Actinocorallia herbida]|uniref:Uncharacterized protein n=1 Tax=Actinocorallia herbida TaxID=58109 RepID=A0A3N1D8W0_9ACTN|nr:hypothetical protein EDD29_7636 [Actinocorallia herbida]